MYFLYCIAGIKKPNHRKRLKAEIDNLNIGDGLPEHVPGSLEEWLRLLRLEEYLGALHQQGMRSVEDVTTLTWEDLEDIGIVRLGHQKRLLLAIKRVKDIRAGKRIQPLDLARLPPHPGHTQVSHIFFIQHIFLTGYKRLANGKNFFCLSSCSFMTQIIIILIALQIACFNIIQSSSITYK